MRDSRIAEDLLYAVKEGDVLRSPPTRVRRKGIYLLSPFDEKDQATKSITVVPTPPAEEVIFEGTEVLRSPSTSSVDVSSLCGQGGEFSSDEEVLQTPRSLRCGRSPSKLPASRLSVEQLFIRPPPTCCASGYRW